VDCLQIVFVHQTSDFEYFFSAFSFYPGHGDSSTFPTIPSRFETEANQFNHSNEDSGEDLEDEDDWLDDFQAKEPAQRAPSKMSEAVAVEVGLSSLCLAVFELMFTFLEAFVADS
jgi:hypothetical protein